MFDFAKKFFGREDYRSLIERITVLEPTLERLSRDDFLQKTEELRRRVANGEAIDAVLPEAFALTREAAKRTLGQRHYDVQLMGGIALHQGKVVQMMTGEGKTLAATAPAYLNALTGRGVHVITVNDYLARRDAVWMGQIYNALGLTVACLTHEQAFRYDPAYKAEAEEKDEERDVVGGFKVVQEFLRPITRREAYEADITYGTNHEFGFDYLRDNLAYSSGNQVQPRRPGERSHYFAIIDEVDSILIDEARTPLIIAVPDTESSQSYRVMRQVVSRLNPDEDYAVDEKARSVAITDEGINKVEKMLRLTDLYGPANFRLVHYLEESLKAKALFIRDKHYVVKNGEVIIVDEFTGRLMHGRRYSGGLHQAIEAKESVLIKEESRTYAQITIQNYFRLYEKIAGMTGTAETSAEEFDKVYKLEVAPIPPNKPCVREDLPDFIYKTMEAKYRAVIEEVKDRHVNGQPVLIGTASIERNEHFSRLLKKAGIPHEVLNAKNHEYEGAIIAQAGKAGAVTVATNMAGRGVDIILGGNPPDVDEHKKVAEAGGLYVIGTDRHEARRIDDQLRGRSGRQGDPGKSRFFLSLEDDLLRIFGGEKIKGLMETFHLPEDQPIESNLVTRVVNEAQRKVEGFNFDSRKHLLEYDDILNKQRIAFYNKRQEILEKNGAPQILSLLDVLWMNYLEDVEALRESVGMRAYGQHEPLVEFRRDSHILFKQMLENFEKLKEEQEARMKTQPGPEPATVDAIFSPDAVAVDNKIGRNDPCLCGSGKKWKKCGLLNTEEHKQNMAKK